MILVFNDEAYCGDYDEFDMANEIDTLEQFLKLKPEETPVRPQVISTVESVTKTIIEDNENKENETDAVTSAGDEDNEEDDGVKNEV